MKKIALLAALMLLSHGGVFASDPASATSSVTSGVISGIASSPASSTAISAASNASGVVSPALSPALSPAIKPALAPITPSSAASSVASTTPSTSSVFQALLGFAAVLVLMVGLAWMAKRFSPSKVGAAGSIKIVGGVNVGNRERVLVVEVGDQWVVVGVAPGRVSSLATMARQAPSTVNTASPETPNFAQWLKKTIDKRNGSQN